MNEMVKTIKEIHEKDICLLKIGTFYHVYGRDAYIISYLFGYKIKSLDNNHKECGFPENALAKVMAKLENLKINYLILDKRNSYDVDKRHDLKNLNRYQEFYEKANKYINYKTRIETITTFLTENIDKKDFRKILSRMEDVMYERGEV